MSYYMVGFGRTDCTPDFTVSLAGYGNYGYRLNRTVRDHIYVHTAPSGQQEPACGGCKGNRHLLRRRRLTLLPKRFIKKAAAPSRCGFSVNTHSENAL